MSTNSHETAGKPAANPPGPSPASSRRFPAHIEVEIARLPWLCPPGFTSSTCWEMREQYGATLERMEKLESEVLDIQSSLDGRKSTTLPANLVQRRNDILKILNTDRAFVTLVRMRQDELMKELASVCGTGDGNGNSAAAASEVAAPCRGEGATTTKTAGAALSGSPKESMAGPTNIAFSMTSTTPTGSAFIKSPIMPTSQPTSAMTSPTKPVGQLHAPTKVPASFTSLSTGVVSLPTNSARQGASTITPLTLEGHSPATTTSPATLANQPAATMTLANDIASLRPTATNLATNSITQSGVPIKLPANLTTQPSTHLPTPPSQLRQILPANTATGTPGLSSNTAASSPRQPGELSAGATCSQTNYPAQFARPDTSSTVPVAASSSRPTTATTDFPSCSFNTSAQISGGTSTGSLPLTEGATPQMHTLSPDIAPPLTMRDVSRFTGTACHSWPSMFSPTSSKFPAARPESKHILNEERLDQLCREAAGGMPPAADGEYLEDDAKNLVLDIADNFVDDVIRKACSLAKARNSKTLDLCDIQLILERVYNIHIPGCSVPQLRTVQPIRSSEKHKQMSAAVKRAKEYAAVQKAAGGEDDA